jgi:hypothetical protein
VSAKSRTNFERPMRKRIAITLLHPVSFTNSPDTKQAATHQIKLSHIQQTPSNHPSVFSPLMLLHPSTISSRNGRPATSTANRTRANPQMYHVVCRSRICVAILRGGSSVSAPGRGGRRRRAMGLYGFGAAWRPCSGLGTDLSSLSLQEDRQFATDVV